MKKLLALVLAVLMACCLFGCGSKTSTDEPAATTAEEYDVVFLADLGSIYDGGFNEFSYKGIADYADSHGLTYNYLQPGQDSDDARVAIFKQAVEQWHAKTVVAVGFLWDNALIECVPQYPDTKIIFIDADELKDENGGYYPNLALINFAEQQSGFLAGYAMVKAGFRNMGFFGGMGVPAVIRYGMGWCDGAEAAAKDLGLEPGSIKMNYWYSGSFEETPEKTTTVSAWYESGTEMVFSCGGTIVGSAVAAAEAGEGRYIVGVDIDQSGLSDRVLTSAMKSLVNTISNAVAASFGDGDWSKYSTGLYTADAVSGGVAIAETFDKFEGFTAEDYEALKADLAAGKYTARTDKDVENGNPTTAEFTYVVVDYKE